MLKNAFSVVILAVCFHVYHHIKYGDNLILISSEDTQSMTFMICICVFYLCDKIDSLERKLRL